MVEFNMFDLSPMMPEIFLAITSLCLLILGVFKGNNFASKQIRIAIAAMIFLLPVLVASTPESSGGMLTEMFVNNSFTIFSKSILLIGSILVMLLSLGFYRDNKHNAICEFPVLVLLSIVGMMLMISANNLIALYMGLELQSLALYVLASLHRDNLKSSEAGLKYFVLGSAASGILLYGCSLIYGFSGTTSFEALSFLYASSGSMPIGVLVGMIFVITGFCFKISAVPFHMWTPDVYEGSPTPVTAFFAVAPKVAAISLFVRFLIEPFGGISVQWQQIVIFVSVLSMVVGALGALKQTNIKRLIAYSSIGHVGYILVGLASASNEGIRAVLVYLVIYVMMSVGIFACIMMIKHRDGISEDISSLSGLAKTRPLIALIFAIILFSMAGIPPFAGFFGKFFIFYAAVQQGLIALSVIGVLSSVIAAFYYIRIVKIMYFDEASVPLGKEVQKEMTFLAGISGVFNLLFFVSFTSLLSTAQNAANSLF